MTRIREEEEVPGLVGLRCNKYMRVVYCQFSTVANNVGVRIWDAKPDHYQLLFLRSERSRNFRSVEHSLPWNFRSSGVNVPRTFVPMKLLFHENEYSKNFRSKCPKTWPETGYKPYNSLRALITRCKKFSATDLSAVQCWRKGVISTGN